MTIRLMYGAEFWDYIEGAIPLAKKHVFLLSAYTSDKDISNIFQVMPLVPNLVMVRDDCPLSHHYPNLIFVNHGIYHAKVYVIDDTVIIGSQNLNKVTRVSLNDKIGEVSVKFETNESSNIIYQALILILKSEYQYYFSMEVDKVQRHYEISYQSAWAHVAGNLYLDAFRENRLQNCPCCSCEITINTNYFESDIDGASEDEESYYFCNNCNFMIKVFNYAHCYDRPWETTEQVTDFRCTPDFSLFLQLHFYLAMRVGRVNSLNILKSLNILGSIHYLDLNKRDYNGIGLWD
ncbi:phospholipase D-like domain-containing protein [Vibrio owensii]|uniref:hypothetical protein n=1 Tax=Vibrio owensii TaxID=696485 RepID=UPI0038CD62DE